MKYVLIRNCDRVGDYEVEAGSDEEARKEMVVLLNNEEGNDLLSYVNDGCQILQYDGAADSGFPPVGAFDVVEKGEWGT